MKKSEINEFIERMEEIGDPWTPEQVEDVYGSFALEDALNHRKSLLEQLFGNIGKILNS